MLRRPLCPPRGMYVPTADAPHEFDQKHWQPPAVLIAYHQVSLWNFDRFCWKLRLHELRSVTPATAQTPVEKSYMVATSR